MDIRELIADKSATVLDVERMPVREIVAQKIAKLIGSGAIAVGDSLPSERDLAADMSVSRETIRSAIVILSTHGILRVTQGVRTTVISDQVGYIVKDVIQFPKGSDYDLEQVHQARLFIEADVVRRAAENIQRKDIELLGRMIVAQKTAVEDPVRFLISDREFHTVIYKLGNNVPLADVATNLYSYMLDHRRKIVSNPDSIRASISDHEAIFDGLKSGDPDAAAEAFATHEMRIYSTTRRLLGGVN